MNNKLIISLIIIYALLTTAILVMKPGLHKQFAFSHSQAVVENLPEKTAEDETQIVHVEQYEEIENIQFQPQTETVQNQTIKTQNIKPQYQEQTIKKINTPSQTNKQTVKTQTPPAQQQKQSPKYELPKSIMDIVNNKQTAQSEPEKIVQKQTPPVQQKPVEKQVEKPKPQVVQKPKPVQVQSTPVLTEEEELIVWNKWRSDLQNKVMRDSRIAAPHGTVFRFSFTVNKFGQISNLRVWSDTPGYTNYAVQALKPLLLSYQGKPILNFPAGTKRITTNVAGGFVVSNQDRYTTPNDYSDIERVTN